MINKTIVKIAAWLIAAVVVFFLIFELGVYHERDKQSKLQTKANAVVIKTNNDTQTVADKQEVKQIEYRDRIVYKYKTIKEEVIKYETSKESNVNLDAEFVRLHNVAATNSEVQVTGTASGVEQTNPGFTTTTGEAIGTITDNYEQYYQCQRVVKGWQEFYKDLQDKIPK